MKDFRNSIWFDVLVVLLVALAAALMSGCGSAPRAEQVLVPVPVECKEKMPAEVVLPIDSQSLDGPLFNDVTALQASVEILEGHVTVLRTALAECIKPIAAP